MRDPSGAQPAAPASTTQSQTDPPNVLTSPGGAIDILWAALALWLALTVLFVLARLGPAASRRRPDETAVPSSPHEGPTEAISREGHARPDSGDRISSRPPATPSAHFNGHQPHITGRARVIDGDTIVISGARIRLFGIDAPELDHPWGINAKWALVKLCKGQTVTAEMTGALSHERLVARCILDDGRDLSAEMVRAGFAIDWPKYSGGVYKHLEVAGIRKKFWRAAARQRGRMPDAPRPGSTPRPARSEKRN